MTDQWSITGVDLHVELGDGGRRAGLERALRDAIRHGRLAPGSRLPPTRALAADLGLARGTVTEAYRQLAAEGYLLSRAGSGTVVAPRLAAAPAPPHPPLVVPPLRPPVRYDLRPGLPDLSAFPRREWASACRVALAGAEHAAFGWGDPRGHPALRAELAGYLGRVRGVQTTADLIMVCAGFAHGLSLLGAALRARGVHTLALEDPYLPQYRGVVEATGLRIVSVPVDRHGIRVAELAGTGAQAVVVTPAHQFPLSVPLSAERRMALLAWARAVDGLVVEDDYDGEFRYDRKPLGALQGLAPDRVVYAGTVSKTLGPGVRLGWLAVPAELVEPLVAQRRYTDRHSGVLDQLTFAELVRSGGYDRHVRRGRARYRGRRDALLAALPGRLSGIAAGLHALVELPAGRTEADLIAAAARRSLGLAGLSEHYRTGGGTGSRASGVTDGRGRDPDQALVVGYGTPPDHAFGPALRILVDLLGR